MERYANLSGKSGVEAYRISSNAIDVKFSHSEKVYVYTDNSPGPAEVEHMKALARAGQGLATYIAQVIRDRYDFTR